MNSSVMDTIKIKVMCNDLVQARKQLDDQIVDIIRLTTDGGLPNETAIKISQTIVALSDRMTAMTTSLRKISTPWEEADEIQRLRMLVGNAVRNAESFVGDKMRYRWSLVADIFAVEAGTAVELCREYEENPDEIIYPKGENDEDDIDDCAGS